MSRQRSLLGVLADQLASVLDPVTGALQSPEAMQRLLERLGVFDPDLAGPIAAFNAVQDLHTRLEALATQDNLDFEATHAALQAARSAFDLVDVVSDLGGTVGTIDGLGRDLLDYLFETWLLLRHPLAREVLALLTLLEAEPDRPVRPPVLRGEEAVRAPIKIDRVRLDRLPALLRDPVAVLKARYLNALATDDDATTMADRLFPQIVQVLRALGVLCHYGIKPGAEGWLGDTAPLMQHAMIVYAVSSLRDADLEAGIVVALSPASRGDLGLVVSPFGAMTFTKQLGSWLLQSRLSGQVDTVAWGRHGLTLLAQEPDAEVTAHLVADKMPGTQDPAYLLGASNGTRIELGSVHLEAEVIASQSQQSLRFTADALSSALVIAPGDGDGFLSSILPSDGVRAGFELGLAWSNKRGLTLRSSAGLDATLPIGMSVGGLTLSTVNLSLQARDSTVQAEVSTTLRVSIGPVQAVIERVGIAAALTFPENGGNLGVADLDIGFKSPTGVSLTVDASVVIGGGYLSFDPQKHEYRGVLELQILHKIAVKAVGLLTTQLPDGSKGYSLVLLIFAANFTPIQLGFGFALTAIGGLLGVNRTFNEEALRTGLKNHTLNSVLFPKDVVQNAPHIVSTLNHLFPPANGHHLFGPMAQITWGTPPLITADVGVVLEFGTRLRLLILAQVVAILPKREHDLVRLQMDAVGVLDFDQGTAALDAVLYNSRLLKRFVLTGEMAMRLKWEGSPNFALAIGGLHPEFSPPVNFPRLERIAINLTTGDNPRLRCEAYFAITSNTVQFGARAEFYAAAAGFNVRGEIGFDVLIQLDPFLFLADFYAQLQLRRESHNLFKVRFEGTLAGPRPLHIRGKATFEILWWDVTIRIDRTLVHGDPPPGPEPIDVLPRLKDALSHPGNWVSQLPVGQAPMVTLRGKTGTPTDVLLHPLGTLVVKQTVVPLDIDISRFGQAVPAGVRRFTVSRVSLGEQHPTTEPVRDFFAPAQFFEMSDDEKLSRPSFEMMLAGLRIGSGEFIFTENPQDRLEVKTVEFETRIVDQGKKDSRPSRPEAPDTLYTLRAEFLAKQARFGAAGSSDLRRTGRAKYRTTLVGKHQIVKEGWSVVATDDLTVQSVPGLERGRPASYSEAIEALRRIQRTDPVKARGWKILRFQSEVQAAGVPSDPTGSISGTVINADKQEPLSERVIRVAGSEIFARTDNNGNFTLEGLPRGPHTVLFFITGFQDGVTRTVTVVPGQSVSVGEVALKVRTFTGTLIGQVVVDDTTRAPIAGATVAVTVDPPGESIPTTTETDSDGKFEFLKFPAGFIIITVSKEGFTSITLKGQVKEDRTGNAGIIRLVPN